MSAIGDFVNAIQRIATAAGLLPGRKIVRVLEPLSAVDNPDTGTTDLSVTAGAGGNAYSTTTAPFVQPAKGDNVQISVDSTGWFVPFPAVFMDGVGLYTIVSKDSPTLATLQLQFDIAESGSTVNAGKLVVPTGFPGQDGKGVLGQLDSFFIQPAVGSSVTVNTHNLDFAVAGSIVFCSGLPHGGSLGGWYSVDHYGGSNVTLKNLGYPGSAAPGDTVSYPQDILVSGARGAAGAPGVNGDTGPGGPTGPQGQGTPIDPIPAIERVGASNRGGDYAGNTVGHSFTVDATVSFNWIEIEWLSLGDPENIEIGLWQLDGGPSKIGSGNATTSASGRLRINFDSFTNLNPGDVYVFAFWNNTGDGWVTGNGGTMGTRLPVAAPGSMIYWGGHVMMGNAIYGVGLNTLPTLLVSEVTGDTFLANLGVFG